MSKPVKVRLVEPKVDRVKIKLSVETKLPATQKVKGSKGKSVGQQYRFGQIIKPTVPNFAMGMASTLVKGPQAVSSAFPFAPYGGIPEFPPELAFYFGIQDFDVNIPGTLPNMAFWYWMAPPLIGSGSSGGSGGGGNGKKNRISKIFSEAPEKYANKRHNAWRESRTKVPGERAYDGRPKVEPQWKTVSAEDPRLDQVPNEYIRKIEKNGETIIQVDIANLDLAHLPETYRREKTASIEGVIGIVKEAMAAQPEAKEIVIDLEAASERIHTLWLERNQGQLVPGSKRGGPYLQLSHPEKQKDRDIVLGGLKYLEEKLKEEGIHFVTKDYVEAREKSFTGKDFTLQEFLTAQKKLRETGIWQTMRFVHDKVFIYPKEKGQGLPNTSYLEWMLTTDGLTFLPENDKILIRDALGTFEDLHFETIEMFSNPPIEILGEDLSIVGQYDYHGLWFDNDPEFHQKNLTAEQLDILGTVEAALLRYHGIKLEDVRPALLVPNATKGSY